MRKPIAPHKCSESIICQEDKMNLIFVCCEIFLSLCYIIRWIRRKKFHEKKKRYFIKLLWLFLCNSNVVFKRWSMVNVYLCSNSCKVMVVAKLKGFLWLLRNSCISNLNNYRMGNTQFLVGAVLWFFKNSLKLVLDWPKFSLKMVLKMFDLF